jgi:hypothetical protein
MLFGVSLKKLFQPSLERCRQTALNQVVSSVVIN